VSALVNIVVPVKKDDAFYPNLLASLEHSVFKNFEVSLVLDGWQTEIDSASFSFPLTVYSLEQAQGPAVARNFGAAKSSSKWLCFCDADTSHHPETLQKALQYCETENWDGLIGSYDFQPACGKALSDYRNLLHSFNHQRAHNSIGSFWGAFGMVKKSAFDAVGGFDIKRFAQPSVEDIELGYRLYHAGYRVVLKADVLLKHHKCWQLKDMMKTDLLRRAIPWVGLLKEYKMAELNRLNNSILDKIAAVSFSLLLPSLILALIYDLKLLMGFVLLFTLAIFIQIKFYRFIFRHLSFKSLHWIIVGQWAYFHMAILGYIFAQIRYSYTKPKDIGFS
jgi:glycosyltransferase involved in cell wall biosynthesis